MRYVIDDHEDWLTGHGHFQLNYIFVRIDGENDRQYHTRTVKDVMNLVRESFSRPVIHLDQITPSL
jgi:transcription antitermination factor NusG